MKKLLPAFLLIALGAFTYSDGDRVGVVTKLSHKGILCKTWEGELLVDSLRVLPRGGGSQKVKTAWAFTVGDESVVPKLQDAMLSGKRVRLHYQQSAFSVSCQGETSYFVDRVDVAE